VFAEAGEIIEGKSHDFVGVRLEHVTSVI